MKQSLSLETQSYNSSGAAIFRPKWTLVLVYGFGSDELYAL